MRNLLRVVFWAAGGVCLLVTAQQPPPSKPAAKAKAGASKRADPEPRTDGHTLGIVLPPHAVMQAPRLQQFTLSNGLRVVLLENHELPTVNLAMIVRAGNVADPDGKSGMADLVSRGLRRAGAGKLDPVAFDEKVDELGVTIEATTGETLAQVVLQATTDMADAALPLFRDAIVEPQFDPDALETLMGAMREDVGRRNAVIPAVLQREFRARLWGPGSARSRRPEYDSVEAISRADVVAFHKTWFTPGNAVLALEGDLTEAAAKAKLDGLFAGWKGAGAPAIRLPEKAAAHGILFAERSDARNAAFIVGHAGGKAGDPTYAAMLVAVEALASGENSRLATRSKAIGSWQANWSGVWDAGLDEPGTLQVRATLAGAFTTDAIRLVREELNNVRANGFTEAEFETAKASALHRWLLRFPTGMELATYSAGAVLNGLPATLAADVHRAMAAVTRADVSKAVSANLTADALVVVAGTETVFDKPLSALGEKVEAMDLTIAPPRPVQAKLDPESEEAGRKWLARMQQALGGREKLAGIRDLSVRSEGTSVMMNAPAAIKLWDRWIAGGVYRQEQQIRTGTQIFFYNGKIAWVSNPAGLSAMPPATVEQVRGEMFRMPFYLALADTDPKRTVTHLGANLVLISESDKYQVRLYLDPETALPQRLVYRLPLGSGATMTVEEAYSDWKAFDGIQWPGRTVVKRNGRKMDDLRVMEAKFNTGLTAAQLEKRP